MAADSYQFPAHRLRRRLREPGRTPLVLVAPGSFSPITFLHLRMFEMAADFTRFNTPEFEVIGGYFTPVSDAYKKAGLAAHQHRCVVKLPSSLPTSVTSL
jgi:nicotinamide mononucleotide adenylyltransferase